MKWLTIPYRVSRINIWKQFKQKQSHIPKKILTFAFTEFCTIFKPII